MKRNLVLCGLCSLFVNMTVFFFAPLEVVLLNNRDFYIPFGGIWFFQLAVALAATVIMTAILTVLPKKAAEYLSALILGTGLAIWIQIMFMNGNMVILTGEKMQISPVQIAVNAAAWVVIIVGVCVLFHIIRKRNDGLAGKCAAAVAAALTVMQGVALVSLILTTGPDATRSIHIFSPEGEFELSDDVNVVEFVLDTADAEYVREMMEEYPEVRDSLSGWVWYPDVTSRYSRTYPSLTYMLSGEDCRYDRLPEIFVEEAFSASPFLEELHEAGTDIRIYTGDSLIIGRSADKWIENSRDLFGGIGELDLPQFESHMLHISLYKCAPYLLKELFSYEIAIANITSFRERPFQLMRDPDFYQDLVGAGALSVTDRYHKAFRLYHLWCAHPGASWNDQLVPEEDQSDAVKMRGTFRIIETYAEKMKQAGVYDNSLIIVTADHGISRASEEGIERARASCPVLMIKYPNADNSSALETDPTMTAHDDLFRVIQGALVGKDATPVGSGKAPGEFADLKERTRQHYYTGLDGLNRETELVEYAIQGNAEDFNNWKETGNRWEIKYSVNPVSKRSD